MHWNCGVREEFKTIEIFGEGENPTSPPVSVYKRENSVQIFENLRTYFAEVPNGQVFTLINPLSDLGEPSFDSDGRFIEPAISVGASSAKTFAAYISNAINTQDLQVCAMNKERRKRLSEAVQSLEVVLSSVEDIIEEEQEAFDNLPESLQEGEKGQRLEENVEDLEAITERVSELISSIEEVIEK